MAHLLCVCLYVFGVESICHKNQLNVGKHTMHGSSGYSHDLVVFHCHLAC